MHFFVVSLLFCIAERKLQMKKQLNSELFTNFFSTLSERIKCTPKNLNRVIWLSGIRGKGLCVPKSEKVIHALHEFGLIGIEYLNAVPDFSPCKLIRITDISITETRSNNFRLCDQHCSEKWNQKLFEGKNNWTSTSVAHWRHTHKYTWHELNDMQSCDLVPSIIHSYFGHLGGVAEVKRKNQADHARPA